MDRIGYHQTKVNGAVGKKRTIIISNKDYSKLQQMSVLVLEILGGIQDLTFVLPHFSYGKFH